MQGKPVEPGVIEAGEVCEEDSMQASGRTRRRTGSAAGAELDQARRDRGDGTCRTPNQAPTNGLVAQPRSASALTCAPHPAVQAAAAAASNAAAHAGACHPWLEVEDALQSVLRQCSVPALLALKAAPRHLLCLPHHYATMLL